MIRVDEVRSVELTLTMFLLDLLGGDQVEGSGRTRNRRDGSGRCLPPQRGSGRHSSQHMTSAGTIDEGEGSASPIHVGIVIGEPGHAKNDIISI
jgi:hypothetical protein